MLLDHAGNEGRATPDTRPISSSISDKSALEEPHDWSELPMLRVQDGSKRIKTVKLPLQRWRPAPIKTTPTNAPYCQR